MRKMALVALGLLSCSTDSTDAGTSKIDAGVGGGADAPVVVAGSMSLSGALSGTGPISVSGLKLDADSFSQVTIAATAPLPANVSFVGVALKFDGAPMASHDYLTADLQGGATIMTGDSMVYAASPEQGTLGTLHLTSADVFAHQEGTTVYSVHGTFTATLVNTTGGSQTVSFSATF